MPLCNQFPISEPGPPYTYKALILHPTSESPNPRKGTRYTPGPLVLMGNPLHPESHKKISRNPLIHIYSDSRKYYLYPKPHNNE